MKKGVFVLLGIFLILISSLFLFPSTYKSILGFIVLGPSDSLSPYAIPIKFTEPSGVYREEFVSYGVPFPSTNQVSNVSNCRVLYDLSGIYYETPSQFKVLSRWGDKDQIDVPIRWLLVTHEISLSPYENNTDFVVDCDVSITQKSQNPNPVQIIDSSDNISVNTGPLQATISKNNFNIFDELSIDGNYLILSGENTGIQFLSQDDNLLNFGTPSSVSIIEQGDLKTTIRIDGSFSPGGHDIDASVFLTFFANSTVISMRYDLLNDGKFGGAISSNPAEPTYFKGSGLVFNLSLQGSQNALMGVDSYPLSSSLLSLRQRSLPPVRDFVWRNGFIDSNNTIPADLTLTDIKDNLYLSLFNDSDFLSSQNDSFFDDFISISDGEKGLALGGRYLWQRQPKDWEVSENYLALQLWPSSNESYTYEPYFQTQLNGGYDPDFNNPNSLSSLVDSFYNVSAGVGVQGMHIFEGGRKLTYDIWINPHSGDDYSSLHEDYIAWRDPVFGFPIDSNYIQNTGALAFPFMTEKDWVSESPSGLETAFKRYQSNLDVRVDPSVASSGGSSCIEYYLEDGMIFGGHPAYSWKHFGDSIWDGSQGYSNNHYGILEGLYGFWADPTEYRFYEYSDYKGLRLRTYGTKWFSSNAGERFYQKGLHNAAFSQVGSHQWYLNDYVYYLQTGDLDSFEVVTTAADTVINKYPISSTYANFGGARITAGRLRPLNLAYLMTGDEVYKDAIVDWLYSIKAGFDSANSTGCPAGVIPNQLELNNPGANPLADPCSHSPWMHDFLLKQMIIGYEVTGLNDSSLVDLYKNMADYNWDYALVNGTGPNNSYIPYNQCQRSGSQKGVCWQGLSRLNVPNTMVSQAWVYELTGDTKYLNRAIVLFDEWSKWGWLNPSTPVDVNDVNDYHPIQCISSSQYPGSSDEFTNIFIEASGQTASIIYNALEGSSCTSSVPFCGGSGVCSTSVLSCNNSTNDWECIVPSDFEIVELSCGDSLDNDCDGLIDCQDFDCLSDTSCLGASSSNSSSSGSPSSSSSSSSSSGSSSSSSSSGSSGVSGSSGTSGNVVQDTENGEDLVNGSVSYSPEVENQGNGSALTGLLIEGDNELKISLSGIFIFFIPIILLLLWIFLRRKF